MRSSRRKRNRKDGGGGASYLALFVIGPIISIILGAGVVKYIILPQFVPDEESSNSVSYEDPLEEENSLNYNNEEEDEEITELEKSTFSLSSLELYGIQLGNFSTIDNAKTLVEELTENKLSGYIVKKDGYRVLVGSYFTREEADEKIVEIRENYSDAFISTAQVKGEDIEYFIVDENYKNQLQDVIGVLNNSFSKESTLWEEVLKNKDIEDIRKLIEDNNGEIISKLKEIDNNIKSPKLKDLMSKIHDTINIRKEIIEDLKDNSNKLSNIYKDYNDNLYDYVKFVNEL